MNFHFFQGAFCLRKTVLCGVAFPRYARERLRRPSNHLRGELRCKLRKHKKLRFDKITKINFSRSV